PGLGQDFFRRCRFRCGWGRVRSNRLLGVFVVLVLFLGIGNWLGVGLLGFGLLGVLGFLVRLLLLLGGHFIGLGNRRVGDWQRVLGEVARHDVLDQCRTHLGRLARILDFHPQGQAPALGFRVVTHAVFDQL